MVNGPLTMGQRPVCRYCACMRRMVWGAGGMLAAVVVFSGLVVPAAGAAGSLPIKSYYQMAVDSAKGYIFVSDPQRSDILVTNLAGQQVATISGQTGVMGLALSADGSTLYAALPGAHAVSAISASTLKQTASYPLPSVDTPRDVAVQSGKVWVSYAGSGSGAVGDINLSATPPAFQTQAAMGGWAAAPLLAADPSNTGVLVAADQASSPGPAVSYKVSVDPVTVNARSTGLTGCTGKIADAAIGAGELVVACEGAASQQRYNPVSLASLGSYPSATNPNAVAIAESGTVAAGTQGPGKSGNPPPPADLYVYKQGGTAPLASYDLWATNSILAARGLAWSADGLELFAITSGSGGYGLQVFYPFRVPTSLKVTTGVLTFTDGQTISITAHLGATYTNRTVSIYAQKFGSTTRTLLKTGVVNSSGALSATYPAVYNTAFIAVFTGDERTNPATVRHSVLVHVLATEKLTGYYDKTTIRGVVYLLYHQSKPLDAAATVAPNHAGECLNFEYQENVNGTWYDFHNGCISLNSSSQVSVPLSLTGAALNMHYRIRADFQRSSSDILNINGISAWQYFMVEK
jgi:sugar lactone lactonase YvrE